MKCVNDQDNEDHHTDIGEYEHPGERTELAGVVVVGADGAASFHVQMRTVMIENVKIMKITRDFSLKLA